MAPSIRGKAFEGANNKYTPLSHTPHSSETKSNSPNPLSGSNNFNKLESSITSLSYFERRKNAMQDFLKLQKLHTLFKKYILCSKKRKIVLLKY